MAIATQYNILECVFNQLQRSQVPNGHREIEKEREKERIQHTLTKKAIKKRNEV